MRMRTTIPIKKIAEIFKRNMFRESLIITASGYLQIAVDRGEMIPLTSPMFSSCEHRQGVSPDYR